jgi:hypothetical protein
MEMERTLVWSGLDEWTAEVARLHVTRSGVSARGVQISADPYPYRLDYDLDATDDWVTRRLRIDLDRDEGSRRLVLERDDVGRWTANGETLPALDGALDCDLMRSPVTNLMPIRRAQLHEQPGAVDLVVAWVSVPDLVVHTYPQRYEHVRTTADGSVVRFIDQGPSAGFVADLVLDADGLVLEYPEIARRVTAPSTPT